MSAPRGTAGAGRRLAPRGNQHEEPDFHKSVGLTIILALYTGHNILHQVFTRDPQFL